MMSKIFEYGGWDCPIETLLSLITGMTERLRNLNPHGHMNHPGCFMQDMELINDMVEAMTKNSHNFISEIRQNFFDAIRELQDIARLSREMGIRKLSSCNGFRVTPTLVSIDIFSATGPGDILINQLFAIPGNTVSDTLSTLWQHRHIIKLCKVYKGWSVCVVDLQRSKLGGIDEGWLSRSEWRDQRVSLVCECFKSIVNNLDNDWGHLIE